MKKSTVLYLLLNVVIMLIPLLCISALSYKIRTGDVIDVKAKEASYFKHITLPNGFHELEVSSNNPVHRVSVDVRVMDSVNTLTMDTTTYKYITYKLSGDKLLIHYDYTKDSLDNYDSTLTAQVVEYDEDGEETDVRSDREVIVYVKSNVTKINASFAYVTLDLDDAGNGKLINDLDVFCDYAKFNFNAPYRTEEDEDGTTRTILYAFQHRLNLKLINYSDADLRHFSYLKKLNLELKKGSKINDYFPTEEFNLTVDKESIYLIDVNELKNVKIKYEE
ncbi:MAG: hypothetical protein K0R51_74 [Cytophagaceae bacterium]|jgi:hypothetical protein|nr:hypothetical protein [Cytophagaceae bacterium]